jgi:hypothetical protein
MTELRNQRIARWSTNEWLHDNRTDDERLSGGQPLDVVGIGGEDRSASQADRNSDHRGVDRGIDPTHSTPVLEMSGNPRDPFIHGKHHQPLQDLVHPCILGITEECLGEHDRWHHDRDASIPRGGYGSLRNRVTSGHGPQSLTVENQRGPRRRRALGDYSSSHWENTCS